MTVAVGVGVPGGGVHRVVAVRLAAAVVVDPVADLDLAGVHVGVGVVAVGAHGGQVPFAVAALHGVGRVPVAVPVGVDVPGLGALGVVVCLPVAVVVQAVAELRGLGPAGGVVVVAVAGPFGVAVGQLAGLQAVGVGAEAVVVAVGVEGALTGHVGVVVVDQAVAVVVDAVAGLVGAGEHGGVVVVAVQVLGDPVLVCVDRGRLGVGGVGDRRDVRVHGQTGLLGGVVLVAAARQDQGGEDQESHRRDPTRWPQITQRSSVKPGRSRTLEPQLGQSSMPRGFRRSWARLMARASSAASPMSR